MEKSRQYYHWLNWLEEQAKGSGVITKCKDCLGQGGNFPHDFKCGNCNSYETEKFYNEEVIIRLVQCYEDEIKNREERAAKGAISPLGAVGDSIFNGSGGLGFMREQQSSGNARQQIEQLREKLREQERVYAEKRLAKYGDHSLPSLED